MGDLRRTCSYIYLDKHCKHPVYKDGDTCVFHNSDVEGKTRDFKKSLDEYISVVENESSVL